MLLKVSRRLLETVKPGITALKDLIVMHLLTLNALWASNVQQVHKLLNNATLVSIPLILDLQIAQHVQLENIVLTVNSVSTVTKVAIVQGQTRRFNALSEPTTLR